MSNTMHYDVIIVGAGPAGLSAAIRLKQLSRASNCEQSVCILEKGSQVGAHILSGAVLNPTVLQELLPKKWQDAPLMSTVTEDLLYYLTKNHAYKLPIPKIMRNHGNYLISLGELCQFLAKEAESLGCDIYSGFAATRVIYHKNGAVMGVKLGEVGVAKNGERLPHYQERMKLYGKQTLFAEGCRGQLSQTLMHKFHLRNNADVQTYALGLKEVWRINAAEHHVGRVVHTVGWPLGNTYGGSFIYHLPEQRVAIGLVVGLDYTNPWLDPFAELQRFKTQPLVRKLLCGGERVAYGARALNEGGFQSIPKLAFPGGALIGDAAGFLNMPQLKGIHNAMKSGILAAESTFNILSEPEAHYVENIAYGAMVNKSWMMQELYTVRNVRPGFRCGLWLGLAHAAFELYLAHGRLPWTLKHNNDHTTLKTIKKARKITYPKPDGTLTFDKLSSVYLSNTHHEENQPCHLIVRDQTSSIRIHDTLYASPETRYCPAAVYEVTHIAHHRKFVINAQNCIHCKACDIKDPRQMICWTAPEGGGGPNYVSM